MKKSLITAFLLIVCTLPAPLYAAQLTEPQIQSILGLLVAFEVPAATIQNVSLILRGQSPAINTVVGSSTVIVSLGQTLQYKVSATSSVEFTAQVKSIGADFIVLQRQNPGDVPSTVSVGTNYYSSLVFHCGVGIRVYKINKDSVTLGFYSARGLTLCD